MYITVRVMTSESTARGTLNFLSSFLGWLTYINGLACVLGIVGVSYAAIASHRKEWGILLVLGWILSVIGILAEAEPFFYAQF